MTNADYFKMTLSDRELANLMTYSNSPFISDGDRLFNAFEKWCAETGSVDSNMVKNNPSPFYWQIIHGDNGEQIKTPRTLSVSIQLFLSMPYNKKYWES